ncbi:MAG: hypothetical protein ACKOXB_07740 [Flavobacteriales bacterium]
MDYNDIKSRIERTLESLNGRFDTNIEAHTHYEFYQKGIEQRVSITFGTEDESKIINPVMIILHNLSNLKDNLKNTFKEKGYNPQIIEDEIENSLHLKVLIDIVNQEKHGSPLRNPRSHLNPLIQELSQGFYMASAVRDIEGNITSKDGPPIMKITGIIKDENDNRLFDLDTLIETCYSKWREIIKQYNCIGK